MLHRFPINSILNRHWSKCTRIEPENKACRGRKVKKQIFFFLLREWKKRQHEQRNKFFKDIKEFLEINYFFNFNSAHCYSLLLFATYLLKRCAWMFTGTRKKEKVFYLFPYHRVHYCYILLYFMYLMYIRKWIGVGPTLLCVPINNWVRV